MDATSDRICSYAASLSPGDLTPEALHAVKRSLIDWIGCALGSTGAEPVRIATSLAAGVTSTRPASVLGTSIRTYPEMAAFANGVMGRYLDFNDDYLRGDGPHPSDNIAAVLSMAESLHRDGKALALGIVLAYEVVDSLVDATSFRDKGWDYVTETCVASALGVGKMMGLSSEKMGNALALALAPNIGLLQTRSGTLSMWKGCAGPNAARNGVFAAMLASEGMTGPDEVIEGSHGLWKQVTGKFQLADFGGNGRRFKIEETFFKTMPVRYSALLPVEVALILRGEVNSKEVESIKVFTYGFAASSMHIHKERWQPETRETSDHSIPFLVVAALLDGEISDRTYASERYRDADVLDLMRKLTLEEDPAYTKEFPGTFHCRIEVTDRSGHTLTAHGMNPRGHPSNPVTDAEIEEKFLRLSAPKIGEKQSRSLLALLWNLEEIRDVQQIFTATLRQ